MTIHANILPGLSRSARKCTALILCWSLGLISGFCFGKLFSASLMRSALFQPVSIVGLFVCIFLPLIFTFLSIVTDKPIIILIVCFLKAVAFGFSEMLIFRTYGAASWLIQFLFLFSDSFFCVVLLCLWFRRFLRTDIRTMRDFLLCTFIGIWIAIADYLVVSPILEGLF